MDQPAVSAEHDVTTGLAHRTLSALKWQYAGTFLQVVLNFAVGVILARLLSPQAFGLVGMALIVTGFGRLVGEVGLGVAIIQRPSITREHIRASFTGSVTMGILLFLALWVSAPAISRLFTQPSLTVILRVIGMSLIFACAGSIPVCVLRRELKFRALATIQAISYFVGYGGVGVSLAILGYGVWSLVAANVVQPLLLAAMASYLTKQPLWPYFGVREYRDLFRMASAEIFNTLTNFVSENLDLFVIGKWLGASPLGLYSRSVNLMDLPVRNFAAMLSGVMFPVYSKIQSDIPRLARGHLRTICFTALVTMPVLFAVAAVPGIVIGGIYGAQWKPAAGALRILCVSGPLIACLKIFGALSHARGYIFNEWFRQMIFLAVLASSIWFLLPHGIVGVALAFTFATLIRYLLLAHLSLKLASISWRQFAFSQIPGLYVGLTVSMAAVLASRTGEILRMNELGQLMLTVSTCLICLGVILLLTPAAWFGEPYAWFFERFGGTLPNFIQRILASKVYNKREGSVLVSKH